MTANDSRLAEAARKYAEAYRVAQDARRNRELDGRTHDDMPWVMNDAA